MYFFTSDTHFGCDETLIRENRSFKNHKAFEKSTIKIWNKQIKKDDIIYHLGDFASYDKVKYPHWLKTFKLVKKIKAKVILIIGNSEKRLIKYCFKNNFQKFRKFCIDAGFYEVKHEDFLSINGKKLYLNHFPTNHKKNYINIFGHTHRTTGLWKPFGLNVSCDLNHFQLFSESEIERLLNLKTEFWDDDIENLCFKQNSTVSSKLERYRDIILAENILEYDFIGFYPREFFCFDNFSSFAVFYKGIKYPTVEHAYQAMKFIDTAPEIAKEITDSFSADEAKRIATKNKDKQNLNWKTINVRIMEELLRAKLEQNPYVKQKLIQSKNLIICEDSPYDDFWGIGPERKGQNQLGKLWMKLRKELKNTK